MITHGQWDPCNEVSRLRLLSFKGYCSLLRIGDMAECIHFLSHFATMLFFLTLQRILRGSVLVPTSKLFVRRVLNVALLPDCWFSQHSLHFKQSNCPLHDVHPIKGEVLVQIDWQSLHGCRGGCLIKGSPQTSTRSTRHAICQPRGAVNWSLLIERCLQ